MKNSSVCAKPSIMTDEVSKLMEVVCNIAKEYDYDENNIDVKQISSGGANYTSRLFAVTLSAPEKNELKLFSKTAALGEQMRSMSDIQLYEVEIIFYSKIYPIFRNLEEVHGVPEADRLLLPKYFGGVTDYGNELMILEDLTVKGFKSFDRFKCFDWEYASKCVEKLANFHALTVAFERNDPEKYAEIVGKIKFNKPKDTMADFLSKNFATAVESTDEIYRERVEIFLRNEMKKKTFLKFFDPERKLLLCHGDFRPSNILQKVDEDGNLQLAVVDYQMMRQSNPVIDLIYFLICGSDEEFRTNHLHEYFNHYYDTFSQSLQRLGIDVNTVLREADFREDVKQMLPFGLVLATMCLLFVTVEEDVAPKPEDCIDFNKFDIKPSDQFQIRFNGFVKSYVNLGIL